MGSQGRTWDLNTKWKIKSHPRLPPTKWQPPYVHRCKEKWDGRGEEGALVKPLRLREQPLQGYAQQQQQGEILTLPTSLNHVIVTEVQIMRQNSGQF